jgi:deoxyribodipyrimidine photo-lyase
MIVLWLRCDLRVDDHEALIAACEASDHQVVPVYCLDPRPLGQMALGFPRMGARRAQTLIETLDDLRERLRALGADLLIRRGAPEQVIPALARSLGARAVYWHREATTEEQDVERAMIAALSAGGLAHRAFWGATLYHHDDLPMPVRQLPEVFTTFRKRVEAACRVRAPLDPPAHLAPLPAALDVGALPDHAELGVAPPRDDPRAVLAFRGGERAGLARVQHYLWGTGALASYKETRNGLIGADYSSKLAAWLATGAISPRRVFAEVQRFERERVKNDSTYWLIFELIWRDFFRFLALQHGPWLFRRAGIRRRRYAWREDHVAFDRWVAGQTGVPFVDANMRELAATGFMSNRGRQNVASYLARDLQIDWRWGAAYFESQLIDYDPCSNWGNWQYVAGVGSDPRDRVFNVVGQGERYDPRGEYLRLWLPELAALPDNVIHAPHRIGVHTLHARHGVQLGVHYPAPL